MNFFAWNNIKEILFRNLHSNDLNCKEYEFLVLTDEHYGNNFQEERINNINEMIHPDTSEIEIASEIVELLDMIILATE